MPIVPSNHILLKEKLLRSQTFPSPRSLLWIFRPFGSDPQHRSYSLSRLDELSTLLELEVEEDEDESSAETGPDLGQQTLQ